MTNSHTSQDADRDATLDDATDLDVVIQQLAEQLDADEITVAPLAVLRVMCDET